MKGQNKMKLYKNGTVFSEEEINKLKKKSFYTSEQEYAAVTELKGNETLKELVKKYAIPPLDAENIFEVFGKYGHSFFGIADGFKWDNLESLTELDAYKMIALCSMYWEAKYKKWFHELQAKNERN